MQKRQRTLGRTLAQVALWSVAAVLLVTGLVFLLAGPIAELVASRELNKRGLGPVAMDITRLGLDGVSVRDVSVLGGAVQVAEADVNFTLAALLQQRRIDSIRIDGLKAKIDWAEDGVIKAGLRQIYPEIAKPEETQAPSTPPPTTPNPAPPDTPQQAPMVTALVVGNSSITLGLPSGDIVTRVNATLAQDTANGRALDVTLNSSGPGVESSIALSAVQGKEPDGKDRPAQGSGTVVYSISDLSLPGVASLITGQGNLSLAFDAAGARSENSRADLSFRVDTPPQAGPLAALGIDPTQRINVFIGGYNSQLFSFILDRTLPVPKATIDGAITISSGPAELRAEIKGWADAATDGVPQDFAFERLNLSAKGLKVLGGQAEGAISIADFKGPIAIAGGRAIGSAKLQNIATAKRVEAYVASAFRMDGLSLSFDLNDARLEADSVALGSAMAAGTSRIALAPKATAAQQVNLVFGNGLTLAVDAALSGSVPRLVLGDSQTGDSASLSLPHISLSGYLSQKPDESMGGALKITLIDSLFAHPLAHLGGIAADLTLDGKRLTGPLSADLLEAPDSARPAGLNRRGAKITSNINYDFKTIDIKGKINSQKQIEVGTFGISQSGTNAPSFNLVIPPRTWGANPSFVDIFGPVVGLTNTSGTFGLEVRGNSTKTGLSGALKMAFADFGFTSGAMVVKGLNAALDLNQVWPPRAAAPQRVSVAQLVAGVPFTKGEFTFDLPGDGTARFTGADMELAGGTVTGRNFVVPLDGRSLSFTMAVSNVALDGLVNAFATDGLAATGTLDGSLPLRLSNSRLFIDQARLIGRNGTIAYKPSTPPAALAQGGGTILMQALANFKFDEVAASIDGDITKDLAVALSLKGRNPDLYGGYPIEFNLSLDGPLNQLVREGLSGYRIPEDIKERLQQQGINTQD